MAFVLPGFALETTVTTGTGAVTLQGAVTGVSGMTFRTLVAAAGSGNTVCYAIYAGAAWEIGTGVVTSGANDTLTRAAVLESSNGGSLVNFPSGTKMVSIDVSGKLLEGLLDPGQTGMAQRTGATAWTYRAVGAMGVSLLAAADGATARTALALGALALLGVGDGLELDGVGGVRPKLDGGTLARSAAGLKVADKGIGLSQIADRVQGQVTVAGAAGVATLATPTAAGQSLLSGPGVTPYFGDPVTEYAYDSGALTVSAGSAVAMADHGLSGKPRQIEVSIQCATAVAGYAVGEEIAIAPYNYDGTNARGFSAVFTATQIGGYVGAAGLHMPDRSSAGAIIAVDLTKWNLRIRARRGRLAFAIDDLGSALLAHWDAARTDLITESGGLVSSWRDAVAGYDMVQATGASRPVWSATSFNGRDGLTFDGVDDCLEMASVPFPSGSSGCEIWARVDQTAVAGTAGAKYAVCYGGTSVNNSRGIMRLPISAANAMRAATGTGAATVNVNVQSPVFDGRHVMRGVFGATTANAQLDTSIATALAAVSSTGTTRSRFGAQSYTTTPAAFWEGQIAEVVVTNVLSAAQAVGMAAYMMGRL